MYNKEGAIVLFIKLIFMVSVVYLLHVFVIANPSVFQWHWGARLSFLLTTLFLFVSLQKAENG